MSIITRVLDPQDRRTIGQALIIVGSGSATIITVAATLGLAWRLFNLVAG